MQEVLGPGRQQKPAIVCCLGRCCNSLHRELEIVDGIARIAGRIFDRPTGQASLRRQSNGFRTCLRRSAKPVLQIGRHWQMRCLDNGFRILQDSIARQLCRGIGPSNGERITGAGCRQRFKTQRGQDLGGSRIPWIRDHKCSRSFVESAECLVFLLASHGRHPFFKTL